MSIRRVLTVTAGLAFGAVLLQSGAQAAPPPAGTKRADSGAQITDERWISGRIMDITVRSPAVGRTMKNRVVFPKGWTRKTTRTWPTVYLLGGGGGDDHTIWQRKTQVVNLASHWGVILVMPFNGQAGGFVNWFNYGKRGKPAWETYHTTELRQLVERNLHGGRNRAIVGVSAGALGAMAYAAHKPAIYKSVTAMSGLLHLRHPGVPPSLMVLNASLGVDPFRIWGVPGQHDANWKANDPYELAAKLRGIKLYVSSGTTGRPGPLDPKNPPPASTLPSTIGEQMAGASTKAFVARLRKLGIPLTAHVYGDGMHAWPSWNRETKTAWPMIMNSLKAKRVA